MTTGLLNKYNNCFPGWILNMCKISTCSRRSSDSYPADLTSGVERHSDMSLGEDIVDGVPEVL